MNVFFFLFLLFVRTKWAAARKDCVVNIEETLEDSVICDDGVEITIAKESELNSNEPLIRLTSDEELSIQNFKIDGNLPLDFTKVNDFFTVFEIVAPSAVISNLTVTNYKDEVDGSDGPAAGNRGILHFKSGPDDNGSLNVNNVNIIDCQKVMGVLIYRGSGRVNIDNVVIQSSTLATKNMQDTHLSHQYPFFDILGASSVTISNFTLSNTDVGRQYNVEQANIGLNTSALFVVRTKEREGDTAGAGTGAFSMKNMRIENSTLEQLLLLNIPSTASGSLIDTAIHNSTCYDFCFYTLHGLQDETNTYVYTSPEEQFITYRNFEVFNCTFRNRLLVHGSTDPTSLSANFENVDISQSRHIYGISILNNLSNVSWKNVTFQDNSILQVNGGYKKEQAVNLLQYVNASQFIDVNLLRNKAIQPLIYVQRNPRCQYQVLDDIPCEESIITVKRLKAAHNYANSIFAVNNFWSVHVSDSQIMHNMLNDLPDEVDLESILSYGALHFVNDIESTSKRNIKGASVVVDRSYLQGNYGFQASPCISIANTGIVQLTRNRFRDNVNQFSGGGAVQIVTYVGYLGVVGNTFTNNSANGWAGGLLINRGIESNHDFEFVDIIDNHFSYNKAKTHSGAFDLQYVSKGARIENNTLLHNSAQAAGAARLFSICFPKLKHNTFKHNNASLYGGALVLENVVDVGNCQGGKSSHQDVSTTLELYMELNNMLEDPSRDALEIGRVNATYLFDGDKIENNQATVGGGIYVQDFIGRNDDNLAYKVVRMRNLRLVNNNATLDGGGMFLSGVMGTLAIEDSVFNGNAAKQVGGGVAILNGNDPNSYAVFTGCEFKHNLASLGGAIGISSVLSLQMKATAIHNNAATHGAGLFCNGCIRLFIGAEGEDQVVLHDNQAVQEGGGLYCRSCGAIALMNVDASGNSARLGAGARILNAQSSVTIIDGSQFTNNEAHSVLEQGSPALSAKQVGSGGALSIQDGYAHIHNTVLKGNKAYVGAAVSIMVSQSPIVSQFKFNDLQLTPEAISMFCDVGFLIIQREELKPFPLTKNTKAAVDIVLSCMRHQIQLARALGNISKRQASEVPDLVFTSTQLQDNKAADKGYGSLLYVDGPLHSSPAKPKRKRAPQVVAQCTRGSKPTTIIDELERINGIKWRKQQNLDDAAELPAWSSATYADMDSGAPPLHDDMVQQLSQCVLDNKVSSLASSKAPELSESATVSYVATRAVKIQVDKIMRSVDRTRLQDPDSKSAVDIFNTERNSSDPIWAGNQDFVEAHLSLVDRFGQLVRQPVRALLELDTSEQNQSDSVVLGDTQNYSSNGKISFRFRLQAQSNANRPYQLRVRLIGDNGDQSPLTMLLLRQELGELQDITQSTDSTLGVSYSFPVAVRECLAGEVRLQKLADKACLMCDKGFYSYNSTESGNKCLQCPSNCECHRGSLVTPRVGYWMASHQAEAADQCGNPKACTGGRGVVDGVPESMADGVSLVNISRAITEKLNLIQLQRAKMRMVESQKGQGRSLLADDELGSKRIQEWEREMQESATQFVESQCSLQYNATLCGACKFPASNGKRYGQAAPFSCRECSAVWKTALVLLVGLLLVSVFVAISIFFTLKINSSRWQECVSTSDLIKVFMVYMQRLSIVVRVHVRQLDYFGRMNNWAHAIVNPLLSPLDCLFSVRPKIGFGIARVLLQVSVPFIVALLALPLLLFIQRLFKRSRQAAEKRTHEATYLAKLSHQPEQTATHGTESSDYNDGTTGLQSIATESGTSQGDGTDEQWGIPEQQTVQASVNHVFWGQKQAQPANNVVMNNDTTFDPQTGGSLNPFKLKANGAQATLRRRNTGTTQSGSGVDSMSSGSIPPPALLVNPHSQQHFTGEYKLDLLRLGDGFWGNMWGSSGTKNKASAGADIAALQNSVMQQQEMYGSCEGEQSAVLASTIKAAQEQELSYPTVSVPQSPTAPATEHNSPVISNDGQALHAAATPPAQGHINLRDMPVTQQTQAAYNARMATGSDISGSTFSFGKRGMPHSASPGPFMTKHSSDDMNDNEPDTEDSESDFSFQRRITAAPPDASSAGMPTISESLDAGGSKGAHSAGSVGSQSVGQNDSIHSSTGSACQMQQQEQYLHGKPAQPSKVSVSNIWATLRRGEGAGRSYGTSVGPMCEGVVQQGDGLYGGGGSESVSMSNEDSGGIPSTYQVFQSQGYSTRTTVTKPPIASRMDMFTVLCLTLVTLFYPLLCYTVFASLTCINTTSGLYNMLAGGDPHGSSSWWVFDMEVRCLGGAHGTLRLCMIILGIPLIVLGLPALVFYTLFSKRDVLGEDGVQQRLLWLYHPYRPGFYFWESWKMLETMAHVAALVLGMPLRPTTRSLILLAVVAVSNTTMLLLRPHRFRAALRLEIIGGCSNTLSLLLLIIAFDSPSGGLSRANVEMGLLVTVLIVELVTLLWFLSEIIRSMRQQVVKGLIVMKTTVTKMRPSKGKPNVGPFARPVAGGVVQ